MRPYSKWYCARPGLVYQSGESDRLRTDAENLYESWIFFMVKPFHNVIAGPEIKTTPL